MSMGRVNGSDPFHAHRTERPRRAGGAVGTLGRRAV